MSDVPAVGDLYDVFMVVQLDDPGLPPELLPAAWPAGRVAAQTEMSCMVGNAMLEFLRTEADVEDRVAGNRYDPPPWAAA